MPRPKLTDPKSVELMAEYLKVRHCPFTALSPPFPPPFHCPSTALSQPSPLPFTALSLPFHRLPHCLSLTFHRLSLRPSTSRLVASPVLGPATSESLSQPHRVCRHGVFAAVDQHERSIQHVSLCLACLSTTASACASRSRRSRRRMAFGTRRASTSECSTAESFSAFCCVSTVLTALCSMPVVR